MKYFFPTLMALVILSGASLALTPYIAEQFFPASKTTLRTADPKQATLALADWFGTSADSLTEVQGINQLSAQGNTSWFRFSVERQPIEYFIRQNRLQQQDLTPDTLQRIFTTQNPPANWWQPATLERQTCFISMDEGRELGLIYHAELKKGFLIIRTHQKTGSF